MTTPVSTTASTPTRSRLQPTPRCDTQTVTVPVDAQTLFAFLAEPRNLPRWAVGFCLDIRAGDDGWWIVQTGHAEIPMQYLTDPRLGVIDYHLQLAPDVRVVAASRVVPIGDRAVYVFTQIQAPGMPDEVFDAQRTALGDELEVLRRLFLARAACGVAGAAEAPGGSARAARD